MFTGEEAALLDAIHADPKSDAPRLAYADWLESQGELVHAEFIRLQCQEPYVVISNRDPANPRQSHSFDFPRDEPTARQRLARLLEILPGLYRSDRYSSQRRLPYYEEHYRGLPLVHVGDEDNPGIDGCVLAEIGKLSRVDLSLCSRNLAEELLHPLMWRADKLHIWPYVDWEETELDPDFTLNSHYDRFWVEAIPLLAESPIIDRLVELRLCGCHSTGELTDASRRNLDRSRRLLEPRVHVDYSY